MFFSLGSFLYVATLLIFTSWSMELLVLSLSLYKAAPEDVGMSSLKAYFDPCQVMMPKCLFGRTTFDGLSLSLS